MSTHNDLRQATIKWVSALLDSASTDIIGVSNWWPRATSALVTAATASTYGEAVTAATEKLQIDQLLGRSSDVLTALESVIGENFTDWQQIISDEYAYLIALTRVTRKSVRKESK